MPPESPAGSTLVFTVALNGYAGAFARCLASQRAYAREIGAAYVAVTRPFTVEQPAQAAWLKIPLMVDALRSGYTAVAFVDSDARIAPGTPDFRSVITEGRTHMARGHSGRFNSGVILAGTGPDTETFLDALMASITEPVPAEDRKELKFENGNVIHVARQTGLLAELPLTWNNTWDAGLDDHVRHYTGPLRAEYTRSRLAERTWKLRKRLVARPGLQPDRRDERFLAELRVLASRCQRTYPLLRSSSG